MMFNQYPYLNLNDLNLDYILSQIKIMMNEVTNFVSINAIKYADPIQWDITRQYEKNTVVIDPVTGTAYISVAPVPAGVALTRPEYWTVVFDLGSFVTRAAQNFTSRYEQETTLTATFPSNMGDWLVWGDVLYKAKTNIIAGDTYVVDSNIEHFTMEDLYNAYLNTIANILAIVGDLADLTTIDTSSIVNAINSVVNDFDAKIGDIDLLNTNDKSNIVYAINEVLQNTIDNKNNIDYLLSIYKTPRDFGAIGDGVTDDTQALIDYFDYCRTNQKLVILDPAAKYLLHTIIYLYSDCSIIGNNATFIFDLTNEDSNYGFALYSDNVAFTAYNGFNNIVLSDFIIDNNGRSVAGHPSIATFHGSNITFRNITIKNAVNNHAIEINSSRYVNIINCKFIDLTVTGEDFTRSAINIDTANYNGFPTSLDSSTYDGTPVSYLTIDNCIFNNVPSAFDNHSIELVNGVFYKHNHIFVSNCIIDTAIVGFLLIGMEKVNITNMMLDNITTPTNGGYCVGLYYVGNVVLDNVKIYRAGNTYGTGLTTGILINRYNDDANYQNQRVELHDIEIIPIANTIDFRAISCMYCSSFRGSNLSLYKSATAYITFFYDVIGYLENVYVNHQGHIVLVMGTTYLNVNTIIATSLNAGDHIIINRGGGNVWCRDLASNIDISVSNESTGNIYVQDSSIVSMNTNEVVKQTFADISSAPTQAQFNALLLALRNAKVLN